MIESAIGRLEASPRILEASLLGRVPSPTLVAASVSKMVLARLPCDASHHATKPEDRESGWSALLLRRKTLPVGCNSFLSIAIDGDPTLASGRGLCLYSSFPPLPEVSSCMPLPLSPPQPGGVLRAFLAGGVPAALPPAAPPPVAPPARCSSAAAGRAPAPSEAVLSASAGGRVTVIGLDVLEGALGAKPTGAVPCENLAGAQRSPSGACAAYRCHRAR